MNQTNGLEEALRQDISKAPPEILPLQVIRNFDDASSNRRIKAVAGKFALN